MTTKEFSPISNISDVSSQTEKYNILLSSPAEQIRIKNHTLLEIIGKGGFGIVFKAYSTTQKKHVALKFIDPEITAQADSYQRVIREINNAQKIKDPRIVSIYSIEEWEGITFLSMEYYEGQTLKDYFEKQRSWTEFIPLFLKILKAVQVLHDNGIIHRDLKPSNIFIRENGEIVLLDFGLSKKTDEYTETITKDKILGTLHYMSPEQLNPRTKTDARSDIYNLGLILYQAVYNRLPYEGDTTSLMVQKLYSKPEFPNTPGIKIPRFLEFGLNKSLELMAENRFESIEKMYQYFYNGRYPFLGSTLQWIKKRPKTTFSIFFLILLLTVLSWIYIRNSRTIHSVLHEGNKVTVSNKFGIKLFEREYKNKRIRHAVIQAHRPVIKNQITYDKFKKQNLLLLFLEDQRYNLYPGFQSYRDNSIDNKICFVDKNNIKFSDLNLGIPNSSASFYDDFSYSSYFIHFQTDKVLGHKFTSFRKKHNMGMYPSFLGIISDRSFSQIYNPGSFIKHGFGTHDRKTVKIFIQGQNNLMCDLYFFSEMENNSHTFIPSLNRIKYRNNKDFLVFLPQHSIIVDNKWFSNQKYVKFDNSFGNFTIKLYPDYRLIHEKDGIEKTIWDKKKNLFKMYNLIDDSYKIKIYNRDYKEALKYIGQAQSINLENPWLKSVLYFYSGDLKIDIGDFDNGLKDLKESLRLYSNNTDSFQRIFELYFLRNQEGLLKSQLKNYNENMYRFFGLAYGKDIFRFYISLHFGNYVEAAKVQRKIESLESITMKNIGNTSTVGYRIFKTIYNISSGEYYKAIQRANELRGKLITPFTLNEFRLIYIRAAILQQIFESNNKTSDFIKLARFYTDDIYNNTLTMSHFSSMSKAYFYAMDGDKNKAEQVLESNLAILKKMNIGDFFTRFWYFCDMFIYGKTNEILGNRSKALIGYKECIRSNPHSDLAQRAKTFISSMKK